MNRISRLIALLVIGGGLLVMLGWLFDISLLKSFFPELATMKFTTALCFVSAGIILLFFSLHDTDRFPEVSKVIVLSGALVIFTLVVTVFVAGLFDIRTGLENFFVSEIEVLDPSIPGRPSTGTLVGFLLIVAETVMILVRSHKSVSILVCSIGIAAIGIIAIFGYIFEFPALYWGTQYLSTAMAPHTALLFALLGTGFVLVSTPHSHLEKPLQFDVPGSPFRVWPIFSMIPIVILSLLVISNLKVEISNEALRHLETTAYFQALRVEETIDKYDLIVRGISSRTQLRKELLLLNNAIGDQSLHYSQIHTILSDAIKPLNEVKEIALFDERDTLVLISPQKSKYDEYRSLLEKNRLKQERLFPLHIQNEYSLYFVEPLIVDDKIIGRLIFNFGSQLFQSVTDERTGLGDSGETIIGYQNDAADIEFLTEVRFPESERSIKRTETELPIVQALVNKREGVFESTRDYRKVPVIAVSKYLEREDWGLVVKIDQKEAFARLYDTKISLLLITLVAAISLVGAGFIVSARTDSAAT